MVFGYTYFLVSASVIARATHLSLQYLLPEPKRTLQTVLLRAETPPERCESHHHDRHGYRCHGYCECCCCGCCVKSCYLMRSPVEHKTIGEQKTEDTNPTALSDKARVLWTTSLLS